MTSLELPAAGLAALVVKYRTMVALRLSHGKGMPPAPKQALLALASDFPGALAELEVVPTDELLSRLAALEHASRGGPVLRWMLHVFAFHAALREALSLRRERREGTRTSLHERRARAGVPIDDELLSALEAPADGRAVPVVIAAVARWTGDAPAEIEAVVRPRAPRRRR